MKKESIVGMLEESKELQRFLINCVDHLEAVGGRGIELFSLFAPLEAHERLLGELMLSLASRFEEEIRLKRSSESARTPRHLDGRAGSSSGGQVSPGTRSIVAALQSSSSSSDRWFATTPRGADSPSSRHRRASRYGATLDAALRAIETRRGTTLQPRERARVVALALTRSLTRLHPLVPPQACPTLQACATLDRESAVAAIRAFFMMPTGLFPKCHRRLLRRVLPLFARASYDGA